MKSDTDFAFIVWINHGSEGWHPRGFDTLPEALIFIQSGTYSSFVLTSRMALTAVPAPEVRP